MKAKFVSVFTLVVCFIVLTAFLLGGLSSVAQAEPTGFTPPPVAGNSAGISRAWHDMSLLFMENVGQFKPALRFQVRGRNSTLYLTEEGLQVTLFDSGRGPQSTTGVDGKSFKQVKHIKLTFVGANPTSHLEPFHRLTTHISYFKGQDPRQWQIDVPVWAGVRYKELYPGIDLELAGQEGRLIQRLVVRPGANLQTVRLNVTGASELTVDGNNLKIDIGSKQFSLPLLQVVGVDGEPMALTARSPILDGKQVIMPFANRPTPTSTSIGIPDLLYSTFIGGGLDDVAHSVAVDETGNLFLTGETTSPGFPVTTGAYNGKTDAFVAKINPDGVLDYAIFLGGDAFDSGTGIAVDELGQAYITGRTTSSEFPVTPGSFDLRYHGGGDAFVAKVNTTGTALIYATFLGGEGQDEGAAIAGRADGSAYITGLTQSSNFPVTTDAFDNALNSLDAFVAVMNPTGTDLSYATFMGGSSEDAGSAIALDSNSSVYVVGQTFSADFPLTPDTFDQEFDNGEGFLVKLRPGQNKLDYATFLGGDGTDSAAAIALDADGNAYVTGSTQSPDFPVTSGVFDTTYNGIDDAFVVKITPTLTNGNDLVYATFLGGSDAESGTSIAVDTDDQAHVTGGTFSADFPTVIGGFDIDYNSSGDAFLAQINPAGTAAYSSFIGGSSSDWGWAIALDGMDNVYLAGETQSENFPRQAGRAFNVSYGGGKDAFVSNLQKIEPTTSGVDLFVYGPALTGIPLIGSGAILIQYSNLGATVATSVTLTATLDSQLAYVSDTLAITPTENGDTLTWNLPDVAYLQGRQFAMFISGPDNLTAIIYPITLTIASASLEADPDPTPNMAIITVRLVGPVYLPLVIKSP